MDVNDMLADADTMRAIIDAHIYAAGGPTTSFELHAAGPGRLYQSAHPGVGVTAELWGASGELLLLGRGTAAAERPAILDANLVAAASLVHVSGCAYPYTFLTYLHG